MIVKILSFFVALPLCLWLIQLNALVYKTIALLGYLLLTVIISWQLTSLFVSKCLNERLPKVNPKEKIVLVTGCDSGFGFLTAKLLNKYGFTVFAGCLLPSGDGAKKLKLEAADADKMIIVQFDVTSDKQIDNVFNQVKQFVNNGYQLWGLVNNAGIAVSAEIEWGSFENHFGRVFDVNIFAVIKVTRKFLPLLRRSKGRIVNMASVAGRVSPPALVSYSMTKHAVVAFTDGLRREMMKFGVDAITVEPSFYKTNMTTGCATGAREIWLESDPEIRRDYGEEYFEKGAENINKNISDILSDKPEEVATAILDSLVTTVVSTKQLCCPPWQRPLVNLALILPTEFTDLLCLLFSYVNGYSRPTSHCEF